MHHLDLVSCQRELNKRSQKGRAEKESRVIIWLLVFDAELLIAVETESSVVRRLTLLGD